MSLALLPAPQHHSQWSASILEAYSRLNTVYQTTSAYIASEALESHRLQQYGKTIITDAYPLLALMEESAEHKGIPYTWIDQVANQFAELFSLIEERWGVSEGQYVSMNSFKCIDLQGTVQSISWCYSP